MYFQYIKYRWRVIIVSVLISLIYDSFIIAISLMILSIIYIFEYKIATIKLENDLRYQRPVKTAKARTIKVK